MEPDQNEIPTMGMGAARVAFGPKVERWLRKGDKEKSREQQCEAEARNQRAEDENERMLHITRANQILTEHKLEVELQEETTVGIGPVGGGYLAWDRVEEGKATGVEQERDDSMRADLRRRGKERNAELQENWNLQGEREGGMKTRNKSPKAKERYIDEPPPAPKEDRIEEESDLLKSIYRHSKNGIRRALQKDKGAAEGMLLDRYNKGTVLCEAIRVGCDSDIIRDLLAAGADSSLTDNEGNTPIGLLTGKIHGPLVSEFRTSHGDDEREVIRKLLIENQGRSACTQEEWEADSVRNDICWVEQTRWGSNVASSSFEGGWVSGALAAHVLKERAWREPWQKVWCTREQEESIAGNKPAQSKSYIGKFHSHLPIALDNQSRYKERRAQEVQAEDQRSKGQEHKEKNHRTKDSGIDGMARKDRDQGEAKAAREEKESFLTKDWIDKNTTSLLKSKARISGLEAQGKFDCTS